MDPCDIEKIESIKHIATYAMKMAKYVVRFYKENMNLEIEQPRFKDFHNITRKLDQQIYSNYVAEFKTIWNDLEIIGEEGKPKKREKWVNLAKKNKTILSIDPVDGTDLVIKGLSNWCTALFLFAPGDHMIASFVGFPDVVYYAHNAGAFKTFETEEKKLSGIQLKVKSKSLKINTTKSDRNRNIRDATICFYGQKPSNLLSVFNNKKFMKLMQQLESQMQSRGKSSSARFRIYNFAGNPMMTKLIDGAVDAVMDLKGQKLYDVIPGAFIAQKAGAFWGDLEGNEITEELLLKKYLCDPEASRIKYILASSKELYEDIIKYL